MAITTDARGELPLEPFRMEIADDGGFIECSPDLGAETPAVVVTWIEVPPNKQGRGMVRYFPPPLLRLQKEGQNV